MEIQKIEYLENEKSFLDAIKNIFHSFWRAIIWWSIKFFKKIADASFKVGYEPLFLEWTWAAAASYHFTGTMV